MNSEIIDAVTGWDSAPAGSGHEGLRKLADSDFTGAVVANLTWGFMLNGRLLGVFDGTIDDFDDTSFEAHRAPAPALPLLYAMMETGGETRAQYYTEETPLADADSTLSAGGFTGYVELSENVLSGDYYTVYHGGKSLSAAYVGNSRRLITDDEAFEQASDEIGIYKVIDVDLDFVDIPEPESASTVDAASTSVESESDAPTTDDADAEPEAASQVAESEPDTAEVSIADAESDDSATTQASQVDATQTTATADADSETAIPEAEDGDQSITEASPPTETSDSATEQSDESDDADSDVFSAEAQWRNARSIPSLDPKTTEGESVEERSARSRRQPRGRNRASAGRSSTGDTKQKKRTRSQQSTQQTSTANGQQSSAVKEKLTTVAAERDKLKSRYDALRQERDSLQSKNEKLEARVAELEAEIQRLEAELDEVDVFSADQTMQADEALRGTNLFVRYKRKGEATLEKAHGGQVKREELLDNLRLEHHTTFDTESLSVDGQPYEEFLQGTAEFGFAKWAVTDLLYEIGETGNRSDLAGVFNSIPEVDRVELFGSVSIPLGEEGDTESRRFDIIFRDQMGDPLFVANMNNSRDPATQSMVTQLIKDSKAVAEANETLGSAFVVTKSFFEPEALEATTAETGGGLLSRSKRKSFVKLSRKQGYHLCLVEARDSEFHLNVPDI